MCPRLLPLHDFSKWKKSFPFMKYEYIFDPIDLNKSSSTESSISSSIESITGKISSSDENDGIDKTNKKQETSDKNNYEKLNLQEGIKYISNYLASFNLKAFSEYWEYLGNKNLYLKGGLLYFLNSSINPTNYLNMEEISKYFKNESKENDNDLEESSKSISSKKNQNSSKIEDNNSENVSNSDNNNDDFYDRFYD